MTFNPNIPAAGTKIKNTFNLIATNFAQLNGLYNLDHVQFNDNTASNRGLHRRVTFTVNTVPGTPTSPPVLFTNNVLGLPQLFFYSGTANQSSTQYVSASSGSTFLLGGIVLKWGAVSWPGQGMNVNFASPFPNACFSVVVTNANSGNNPTIINVIGFNPTFFTVFSPNVPTGSNFTYIAVGN